MDYFINRNAKYLSSIVFSTIDIEEINGKHFMSIRELDGFVYEARKTMIENASSLDFHDKFVSSMRKRDFHVAKRESLDVNPENKISYDVYYLKSSDMNRNVNIHPAIHKLYSNYLSNVNVDREMTCSDGGVIKYHQIILETEHETIPFESDYICEVFDILYLGIDRWIMENKESTYKIHKMGILADICRFLGINNIGEEIIKLMKHINVFEAEKFLGDMKGKDIKWSWNLLKNRKQSEFFRQVTSYKPKIERDLHYLTTKDGKVIMRGIFLTFGTPFKLYVIIHSIVHECGYDEYATHSCEEVMFNVDGEAFGLQEIKHESQICGEYPMLAIDHTRKGELFDVGKSLK